MDKGVGIDCECTSVDSGWESQGVHVRKVSVDCQKETVCGTSVNGLGTQGRQAGEKRGLQPE